MFHWHIVDAQSFPLEIFEYPELATYGAYSPSEVYTRTDIQNIVAYAGAVSVANLYAYSFSLAVREVLTFSWYVNQIHCCSTICSLVLTGDRHARAHYVHRHVTPRIHSLFRRISLDHLRQRTSSRSITNCGSCHREFHGGHAGLCCQNVAIIPV